MKNVLTATFLTCICITGSAQINHGYPIDPVPFTSVKVTDNFWGQRLQASREVTIPLAFSKCEETGRYENFAARSCWSKPFFFLYDEMISPIEYIHTPLFFHFVDFKCLFSLHS